VGGADDDDRLRRLEAVHLGQDLVEGLLALVVRSTDTGGALAGAADRVELVDEDDRRSRLLRLGEEITHPGSADADDRLDELRGGDREERRVRLPGDRPGRERLARAGRPEQQDAVGYPSAESHITVRRLEEVDDLRQLGFRLVDSGHVVEGHADRRRVDTARLRASEVAEAAESATAGLRAADQEPEQRDEENRRREPEQQLREQRRARIRVLGVDLDVLLLQQLRQRGAVPEGRNLGREKRRPDWLSVP